jgi:polysaccharide biosynthesis/export protein
MENALRAVGVYLGLGLGLACALKPVPPEFRDEAIKAETFRIGAADLLVVRVWKNPELSVEAPVLPDGSVSVPLAGTVSAQGLTTDELEEVLKEKLAEYITAPEVTVTVSQVNSQRVSVVGEVTRPGLVAIGTDTRVVDAISSAGGFTPYANKGRVKVIRRHEGRELSYLFNYNRFVDGGAPGTNVRVQPGDVVIVPD